MLTTVYSQVGLAVLALVGVFALGSGGPLERHAMGVVALGWLASLGAQAFLGVFDPVLAFMMIDAAALTALVGLTWRSGRLWPLFAVGFQGLATAIDLMRFANPRLDALTYLTALAVAGSGLLAAIVVGTWGVQRERGLQHAND